MPILKTWFVCLAASLAGGTIAIAASAGAQPTPQPPDEPFQLAVVDGLRPSQTTIPGPRGAVRTIATSHDEAGVQSDFVEGVLLLKPRSERDLPAFLQRFGGVVVATDAVTVDPPYDVDRTLRERLRRPSLYVVNIDFGRVDPAAVAREAAARGLRQSMSFSSDDGRKTAAAALAASFEGYRVSPDYLAYPQQAFPETLLRTAERTNPPGSATATFDALAQPRFGARDGAGVVDGANANVVAAWQFLAAHGIERRARVAIIDGGFWLDQNGFAQGMDGALNRGADSDFPLPPARPVQSDIVDDDTNAGGPNPMNCTGGTPCPWHGTGSSSVAVGVLNNSLGAAGTGGQIGEPMLFKVTGANSDRHRAVRRAVAWGADVVSISIGGDCNWWCRQFDESGVFAELVEEGARTAFIASAGNDGVAVGDPNHIRPCTEAHVICVGALADNSTAVFNVPGAWASNFGPRVTVFAPTNIPAMTYPPTAAPTFDGTSASTPYVAGVAAMMKAVNPVLSGDDVGRIIVETARPGMGQATRVIDAFAAVRRAAEGKPHVKDRLEPAAVHDLGTAPVAALDNLNIEPANADTYRFASFGASTAEIAVEFTRDLGDVAIAPPVSLSPDCPAPALVQTNDGATNTGETRLRRWRIGGGAHRFTLSADDLNAYNLDVTVRDEAIAADARENNSAPERGTYLGALSSTPVGLSAAPNTLAQTIHTRDGLIGDDDYFLVRASTPAFVADGGFGYDIAAAPVIQVQENESPVALEVFTRNPDGSIGAPFAARQLADSCAGPLRVRLQPNELYFVKVSGFPGRYRIVNGVGYDIRRVNYFNLENILKKPGPIEINPGVRFLLPPDPSIRAIVAGGAGLRLSLVDPETGRGVAQSVQTQNGARLDISSAQRGRAYMLEAESASDGDDAAPATLSFERTSVRRMSGNLVHNGDFERSLRSRPGPGSWNLIEPATVSGRLVPNTVGPDRNGRFVFGAEGANAAAIRQIVDLGNEWRRAAASGWLKAALSVDLGSTASDSDEASARLQFLDRDQRVIGAAPAGVVGALDREGRAGIRSVVIDETVPTNATFLAVDIVLTPVEGAANEAVADNVALVLTEYEP